MSKKRANRNNKKVLKALKKKRSNYNIGGYGIRRNMFGEYEPPPPKQIPPSTTTTDTGTTSTDTNGGGATTGTGTDTGTTTTSQGSVDQDLLNYFNTNEVAQQQGLSATFDAEKNKYIVDLSGMGFS